jgi:sugar (pentulose or hexulose) kinase
MLYIGIDSGTQSTKSIVVDLASARIIASAQKRMALSRGCLPATWNSIRRFGWTQ